VERFFPMLESVARRPDLSQCAKGVHAVLMAHSQMGGGAFPSQVRIASSLCISERSVGRAIHELQAKGLITSTSRGKGNSNLYSLLPHDNMSGSTEKLSDSTGQNVRTEARQNVRLIEALPIEKEASACSERAMNEEERLEWLGRTLGAFCERLGPPEGAMLQKIAAAVRGVPEDDIVAALQRLFDADAPDRMRSWAFMVKTLPEEVEKLR